jgi:dCTP deaminase
MDTIRPDNETLYVTKNITREEFVIQPGDFVLASTRECISLGSRYAARLEGKSSLGRFGLLTHVTAGFIDPGFMGFITLEIANVSRVPRILHPGMKIGQLCFFKLRRRPWKLYGGYSLGSKYQNQVGPTLSRGVNLG